MKKRCYPKYSYISYFIFSIVMLFLSFTPLIFFREEELIYEIIWGAFSALFAILMLIGGIISMQYFIVEEGIIKTICFKKITNSINLSDCEIEIVDLPTFWSWATTIRKKWICIYGNNVRTEKFKYGCSNKKNANKIQIIYSEETLEFLKKYNIPNFNGK